MSLLEVAHVAKRYGPVVALKSADLVVEPGEIHALLGANGAGKSTLVKILTGVIRHDSGTIAVNGKPVRIASPEGARRVGFAPVFQDPAMLPDLTVAQNLRLTRTDIGATREWLDRMELTVDLTEMTGDLPLPALRMLDLARALARDPQLLLLDEITAALPSDLAEKVFAVMREWRDRGRSVLFITHRLAEVTANCDRASVLRDGHTVGTLVPRTGEEEKIVELMLGATRTKLAAEIVAETSAVEAAAPVAEPTAPQVAAGEPQLEVSGLVVGDDEGGVSFQVRAGEILGVAALEGQGQDLLFNYLAGEQRPRGGGEMRVAGMPFAPHHPFDAIRAGVVLVPADRVLALLPQRPIRENIAAPLFNRISRWGPINRGDERRRVQNAIDRLSIDTRAQRQARRLSGGNQQKLTIARWLAAGFTTMLCFDPTRGIDVGTKRQIYALLRELAEAGAAILLFTSELPEIQLVCDRTVVVYRGAVTAEMPASEADEAALLKAAHGLTNLEAAA
jgi:ribose transport system ATP-binding protein